MQETVELLTSLRNDLMLEKQDAANSGDRVGAAILGRCVNALTRNIDRREAANTAVEAADTAPIVDLEQAAAKAAGKRTN